MSQTDLDIINDYIYSGENESLVTHEWTKLYHHRMFDEPNSQIEYFYDHWIRNTQQERRKFRYGTK
ncbi:hypothetical protein IPL68_05910 [Candidatus Saccharibacteria bacterium]|nr:MAG: hypothetical protein IPL68_05910 [Candidatus Saccharibacteria bacterium]